MEETESKGGTEKTYTMREQRKKRIKRTKGIKTGNRKLREQREKN